MTAPDINDPQNTPKRPEVGSVPVTINEDDESTISLGIEVYLSSEISERAPTKDRPGLAYGTNTKATVTINVASLSEVTAEDVAAMITKLHSGMEIGLQAEIARRHMAAAIKASGLESLVDPDLAGA